MNVNITYDDREITNGPSLGFGGSGGSMNNPMYRKVHSEGIYKTSAGRAKRRMMAKLQMLEYRENDPTYGKPRHKNTNGFG